MRRRQFLASTAGAMTASFAASGPQTILDPELFRDHVDFFNGMVPEDPVTTIPESYELQRRIELDQRIELRPVHKHPRRATGAIQRTADVLKSSGVSFSRNGRPPVGSFTNPSAFNSPAS